MELKTPLLKSHRKHGTKDGMEEKNQNHRSGLVVKLPPVTSVLCMSYREIYENLRKRQVRKFSCSFKSFC